MAEEQVKFKPLVELGSTGLNRWGGYISEEWLTELAGTKAATVYREMSDNDPIIGAVLFAIRMLCRQVDWRVDPADESAEARDAAQFLESCRGDMSESWQDVISEALSMLVYGWAFCELVYKRRGGDSTDPTKRSKYDDGRIGWRKIPIRAQTSLLEWVFNDAGDLTAMTQSAPPDYKLRTIPIEKALLFRTETTKGNPEGRSILRNSYRSWYFKKNIEVIEGIGVERDLAGLPVVWVPSNVANPTTAAEVTVRDAYKTLATSIRRDEQEGILMPLVYDASGNKTYDLTLLSTGGTRQFATDTVINRYNTQIAATCLADFILLGSQKVGSFALASSKTHLFAVAIGAFLDEVQDVFNTDAIPRLFKLNSFKVKEYPVLAHGDLEDVDLAELGAFLAQMALAGAPLFPDETLEKYIRQVAHMPAKGTED